MKETKIVDYFKSAAIPPSPKRLRKTATSDEPESTRTRQNVGRRSAAQTRPTVVLNKIDEDDDVIKVEIETDSDESISSDDDEDFGSRRRKKATSKTKQKSKQTSKPSPRQMKSPRGAECKF